MSLYCKHLLYILVGCICVVNASADAAFTPVGNAKPIHEGIVSRFTDITPQIIVPKAPPAPLAERIPSKPANDVKWINGYWAWIIEKNEYTWICGVYRRYPANHVWVAGEWFKQQGGWVWGRGFWSPVPFDKLVYIEKAPPSAINDNAPQAPGNDYFWAPGCWNYTASTQSYGWLTGKWQQLNSKWILAPACYTWRPDGFVFTPFFWDYHLAARGYAYTCTDNGPLVVMEPEFICQQIFCCYPDYLVFYCHCWHYYPGWWGGCGCIPQWWYWQNWWSLSWNNSWGLWWWWTHGPGPGPIWMTKQLAMGIAPAPHSLLSVFAMKMPKLDLKFGTEVLTATGPANGKELPLPTFTITVTPTGGVNLPTFPEALPETLPNTQVEIPALPQDSGNENLPTQGDFNNDSEEIREGGIKIQQQTDFPSENPWPSPRVPYRPHDQNNPKFPDYPQNQDYPHFPGNQGNQDHPNFPSNQGNQDHPQFPSNQGNQDHPNFPSNQGNPTWNNNSGGYPRGNPGKGPRNNK